MLFICIMRTGFAPVAIPSAPPAIMLDSRYDSPPPSYKEACSNRESDFSSSFRSSNFGEDPPVYLSKDDENDSVFLKHPTERRAPSRQIRQADRYDNNPALCIQKCSPRNQHSDNKSCTDHSYAPKPNHQKPHQREPEIKPKSNKKSHCSIQAWNSINCTL